MPGVSFWFHGTVAEVAARQQRLRDLAKALGYTAIASAAAAEEQGNVPALLEAIDAGEVVVMMLPPEQHYFVADWLERQALQLRENSGIRANSVAEALETIVAALDRALQQQREAD